MNNVRIAMHAPSTETRSSAAAARVPIVPPTGTMTVDRHTVGSMTLPYYPEDDLQPKPPRVFTDEDRQRMIRIEAKLDQLLTRRKPKVSQ